MEMAERGEPILAIEGLRKEFRRLAALKGIDLVLDGPGVYGFLGPNGAGKTTTFKCVCALLRPTAGRVRVGGADVQRETSEAMAKIGVQFDAPAFYPYLSGSENLLVFSKWIGGDCERSIPELLALVGLAEAGRKKVAAYSWGMKQRLGLASALLADPRLVLMDEPTNGLDPAGIADMRSLLPRLAGERGIAVLLSSHRMDEVEQVCDRVIIIHRGEIVADGAPRALAALESRIEIRCADPLRAVEALRERGDIASIERAGADTVRLFGARATAGEVNRFLVERGILVEQVLEKRESLEEIFFRMTGTGDGRG
jgi:ABC-type multidrug transport system ATPase subunit